MRIKTPQNGRSSARRPGAAALELTIILPLFGTLFLGCVDFGRFAHAYVQVMNAARAGAGIGSTQPEQENWQQQVRQAVIDEMGQWNRFEVDELKVNASTIHEPGNHWQARVEVSHPFRTIVSWPGIPHDVTLRHVVVMRATR